MNNRQEKTLLPEEASRNLKKLAHHLKPVVQIGKKGITDPLLDEIDSALEIHELIKIQFTKEHKEVLSQMVNKITDSLDAHHIASIGNIVVLFRQRKEDSNFF